MNSTIADTDIPRAWVGCLGCYNGGTLNGVWLDGTEATSYGEHLKTYERDGVTFCSLCNSDEFWVFDHENFDGVLSGECSPNEAQESAELLAEAGDDLEMFKAWIASGMGNDLAACRDSFIGEFSNDTELGEYFADELGALSIPDNSILARYFDYESYGRDCAYDLHEFSGFYWWNN